MKHEPGTVAVDGRRLKTKGAQTRQLILDIVEGLLATTPVCDLRMSKVAELAGIGMSTAYDYFRSIDEALLALVSQEKFTYARPLAILRRPWPADEAPALARAFVGACLDFWDAHRPVLRVRNLKSDEGDLRFLQARFGATTPMLDALAEKISLTKAAGRLPANIPASAFAALIMAAIERNGAAYRQMNRHSREELIEATVELLLMWLAPATSRQSAGTV